MPQKTNQKLELTWVGKGEEPKLEPRILLEQPEYSYGDPDSENILIHGDNLLALKALEQEYAGRVKCIFIDPPYNTGNAFDHYDDMLEHSQWLNLISPRLKILHNLLSENGSIWIAIDDDESHYLKVLLDEIFGRKNFVSNVIWEKKYAPQNDAKWLSDSHDHILVYAKKKEIWRPNLLPRSEEMNKRYKNPDNDPRGPWKSSDLSVKTYNAATDYEITTPSGRTVKPPAGYCWRYSKEKLKKMIEEDRIWFGKDGNSTPSIKRFLSEVKQGTVSKTIWFRSEVGDNQSAKRESRVFNTQEVFQTPKPEKLVERALRLASNENDIVLDSFLGSGTTAAVAHKMNRRWIGVELGEHAYTHCYPRLKKVISGEDQGGISKDVNWKGGGGFRFYTLAPSLLKQDRHGNWVISEEYNAEMLAAAVAKQEGFTFEPHPEVFWKQGYSTEQDFIYTTTQFVTVEMIDRLQDEMKPDESLLIMCKKFQQECRGRHANITVKKIPQALRSKCEYGKEDYSLNIVNLPLEREEEPEETGATAETAPEQEAENEPRQQTLF